MKTILDYLDDTIERHRKKTGDYPEKLELSKSSFDKIKEEMEKELNQDSEEVKCWWHKSEANYRGILIEIKGE